MNIQARRLKICKQCPHFNKPDHCDLTAEWVKLSSMLAVPRNVCRDGRFGEFGPRGSANGSCAFRSWWRGGWGPLVMARADMGADAFLCCPGPSLAKVDGQAMRRPGAFVLALNTAYPHVDPDQWIGLDPAECYDTGLWKTPFQKVWRWRHREATVGSASVKQCNRVVFANPGSWGKNDWFRDAISEFGLGDNGFTEALHLLVWQGAKKIHLVGCDFGPGPSGEDYHDGRVLTEGRRSLNQKLYQVELRQLLHLLPKMAENGVEVVSCTAGSKANEFLPYVALAEAMKTCGESAVQRPSLTVHCSDVPMCRWQRRPTQSEGVVVGTDDKQAHLLPIWWHFYRKHNDRPVMFCDFGLKEEWRDWCRQRGELVKVEMSIKAHPFWSKPFAILKADFQKILWLDTDTMVCESLDPVFDAITSDIGMVYDHAATVNKKRAATLVPGEKRYNAGVIALQHGTVIVQEWAKACLNWHEDPTLTSYDQDALGRLIHMTKEPVNELPRRFNRLRGGSSACEGDVVAHHIASAGKARFIQTYAEEIAHG